MYMYVHIGILIENKNNPSIFKKCLKNLSIYFYLKNSYPYDYLIIIKISKGKGRKHYLTIIFNVFEK